MIEGADAVGNLRDEPRGSERFERVSSGNADRRQEIASGKGVDEKGGGENARPQSIAVEKQRRDRDPGRRPDRRGARVQERELEAEFAGNEIKRRENRRGD